MSAVVFPIAVAFVMAGFALPPPSSAYPTTTTTTTSTTTSPEEWEVEVASSGPVSSGGGAECLRHNCDKSVNRRYMPLLHTNNFNGFADVIDTLCNDDLPAAERCLEEKGLSLSSCAPMHPAFASLPFFCRPAIKAAMKAGRSCWNGDFEWGMRQCVMEFSLHWGQNVDHCKAVATLKRCARTMMEDIPTCFSEEADLIEEYLRVNTLPLCYNQ